MTNTAAPGLNNVLGNWRDVPDIVLLEIFSYLVNHEDLYHAGLTCGRWYEASKDDLLWKNLTKRKWGIDDKVTLRPGASSWRDEYKRLFYHSPSVPFLTLTGHTASVEHVSSSNSGKYFATCSKDSTVRVWKLEKPFRLKFMVDFGNTWWQSTMSKFNENDTMLLVACRHGNMRSYGLIIIYDATGEEMRKLRIVHYCPWEMFSDWYDGDSFIYGDFKQNQSISYYKCMVGLICPQIPNSIKLCRLSCSHAEKISFITIANISHMPTFSRCLIFAASSQKSKENVHFKFLGGDRMQEVLDEDAIDTPDHTLELNGFIGGLALNQEHTLLYINFLELTPKNNLLQNFIVHVVDIHTKNIIHKCSPGHKSSVYRNIRLILIFLDVSRLYLASGSTDDAAYLWDLHYGVLVARLPHIPTDDQGGVNCVAFSPINEEVLVSVSDDKTIKIWTSRNYRHQQAARIKDDDEVRSAKAICCPCCYK